MRSWRSACRVGSKSAGLSSTKSISTGSVGPLHLAALGCSFVRSDWPLPGEMKSSAFVGFCFRPHADAVLVDDGLACLPPRNTRWRKRPAYAARCRDGSLEKPVGGGASAGGATATRFRALGAVARPAEL